MRSLVHVGFVALLLVFGVLGAAGPAAADEEAPAYDVPPRPLDGRAWPGREALIEELLAPYNASRAPVDVTSVIGRHLLDPSIIPLLEEKLALVVR